MTDRDEPVAVLTEIIDKAFGTAPDFANWHRHAAHEVLRYIETEYVTRVEFDTLASVVGQERARADHLLVGILRLIEHCNVAAAGAVSPDDDDAQAVYVEMRRLLRALTEQESHS